MLNKRLLQVEVTGIRFELDAAVVATEELARTIESLSMIAGSRKFDAADAIVLLAQACRDMAAGARALRNRTAALERTIGQTQ